MFVLVAKAIKVFQYIFYGKSKHFVKKQSVLSELKGNYTDSQARSLMIAIQSTNLILKLSTISTTIVPFAWSIKFIGEKFSYVKSPRDWHRY